MEKLPTDAGKDQMLRWASRAIGHDAQIEHVRRSPHGARTWLLRARTAASTVDAVLKIEEPATNEGFRTEAAALQFAETRGLPAPRLIAADTEGHQTGRPALLTTVLAGTSIIPRVARPSRLCGAGAAAAALHAIAFTPRPDLPLRTRPIPLDDYAAERRWAARYHAAPASDRPSILAEEVTKVRALTGWSTERAARAIVEGRSTPLMEAAD